MPNRANCRINVGVLPRCLTSILLPLLLLLAACHSAWGQSAGGGPALRGDAVLIDLGCVQCHADLGGASRVRDQAPDLGHAGLRYRPGYLFEFLLDPRPVRRHLGRARMPFFHLSEPEALALTLYLETLRELAPSDARSTQWPELPVAIQALVDTPPPALARPEFEREFNRERADGLACLTCHTLQGKGGPIGPELESVAHQIQPAWAARYLVAPDQFGVPATVMPAQFYQRTADGRAFAPVRPDADRKIAAVLGYLAGAGASRAAELDARWARIRQAHPRVTAAAGEQLFRALNCAACHRHPTIGPRPDAAPDLASEGSRVRPEWLAAYLKKPEAIRRSGAVPGDGGRMPDFRLADDEARALATALSSRQQPLPIASATISNTPLSAFAQAKAQSLLETRLSCLGCHQLDGQGGVIGPDLSGVKDRLQPAYVHAIIAEPGRVAPHAGMPKLPLTPATIDLVARHLLQRMPAGADPGRGRYLSPLDHPSFLTTAGRGVAISNVRSNYLRHCAPCHGVNGRGDGFNAAFLQPAVPASFADRSKMSARPDDTLFDGIHSGGAILNRSHWMPPWGGMLAPGEIRGLVRYLRELCGCEGPAWARDGKPGTPRP